MAKIYVMGKWEERSICKGVMFALEDAGHEITCDWTAHTYPTENIESKLRGYAVAEIKGVKKADITVFIAINNHYYKGAFVEMGVALGLTKVVIVVGHAVDSCIFMHHPLVRQVDGLGDILPTLAELMSKLEGGR